jgi:hypothetical protein
VCTSFAAQEFRPKQPQAWADAYGRFEKLVKG